jgi:hypothetical protein
MFSARYTLSAETAIPLDCSTFNVQLLIANHPHTTFKDLMFFFLRCTRLLELPADLRIHDVYYRLPYRRAKVH